MVGDFPDLLGTGARAFVQAMTDLEFPALALDLTTLKAHVGQTLDSDDALLTRLLLAATRHVERLLGFTLASIEGGAPEDLELAVYLTAAHWYENREATLVGVSAMPLPMGVADIIAEYRNYTFAAVDEEESGDE